MYSRTERVIGSENVKKLKSLNIAVLGLGGVGGYVVEMFARVGVGALTIIDFDKVDVSNINRQIIALQNNIGEFKTNLFEKRIKLINPICKLTSFTTKISKQNIPDLITEEFDFVIDAIDDVDAKLDLIEYCQKNKINLISCMGTGNRYKETPTFEVCDIYRTSYDKLAKKIRQKLKERNIFKAQVVSTKQSPEKTESLGSVVYYPLMCAGTIVSYVVNERLKEKD